MRPTNVPSVLSETGVVKATAGKITAMTLTAGENYATAVLDNSTDGTGTELWRLSAAPGTPASIVFNPPIRFNVGIYATLTGTGRYLSVSWE